MKKIIPVILIITIIGVAIYFANTAGNKKNNQNAVEISGTIEVTETNASFQIPGRIIKLIPQEGDAVKEGELIGILDDTDINQSIKVAQAAKDTLTSQIPQLETKIITSETEELRQLKTAEAQIEEAMFSWESIKKGTRTEEIEKSRHAVRQAKNVMENSKKDYERAEGLYRDGAMAAQQRDSMKTNYLTSVEQHKQATQVYKLALAGPRQEDIDAAQARVKQTQANYELIKTKSLQTKQLKQQRDILASQIKQSEESIKQSEIQKTHTNLYSPITGTVLLRPREPGEVVAAGSTVLTLADISDVYLKAYVSETDLGKVKIGQTVKVITDTFPGKTYSGKIYYISDEAEFTPKNLTTKEDRVKLVYRIKINLENSSHELKPGMIADGVIDL